MSKISDFFDRASDTGIKFPFAYDGVTKLPSVTLFFMWVTNMLGIISLVILHFRSDPLIATSLTLCFAVVNTVLYLMRKIQSAKFDLDDRSFELDAGKDEVTVNVNTK